MKFFIVGLHSSGGHEIADILSQLGIRCGKLFSNIEEPSEYIYNSFKYEQYTDNDIRDVFENNAYVFIQELQSASPSNPYRFFEGLSKYEFDNNDVFVMSPDQILSIAPNNISGDICFVWLDNTKSNRVERYRSEKRSYDFNERDNIERDGIQSFAKHVYSTKNSHVLYFTNEEPPRVAAVIYGLIKHPDLLSVYESAFV